MTPGAQYAAAAEILDDFLDGAPIEKRLSNWSRKNRYVGSKDRAAVRDIVFDCLRRLRSLSMALGDKTGRSLVAGHCLQSDIEIDAMLSGEGYALAPLSREERKKLFSKDKKPSKAVQANLPDWLYHMLVTDLGENFEVTTTALCERAPVDIRVNLSKGAVKQASLDLQAEDIATIQVRSVASCLRITRNPRRLARSIPYTSGLVELQDAASQAVIERMDISIHKRILDYCAGGGGKTLALAARAPGAGIFAWDINPLRMNPLKERAKRAGATLQVLREEPSTESYDLVLVDAPCTGSGAWRRNPAEKWRLTPERLLELQNLQAEILLKAGKCAKIGGRLVYITCSILQCENKQQVERFLASNSRFTLISDRNFAINAPGDGFYCAIFKKEL